MFYYLTLLFNYIFLFASGDEGGHEKPSLLSVNPGLIIWTIIIFVILLFVLRKIAWGPLLKALNSREESIKNAIENADKLHKEAEVMMQQNKKNLNEANAKSMQIIEEAKVMAVKVREELINKANEESKKIADRAKQEIIQLKESAMEEMKDNISDLAIKAAEKIIMENLDEQKQKKILNDFLSKIPKN